MLQIYILSSISAIALKAVIFWRYKQSMLKASPYIIGAVSALMLMNIFEFFSFFYIDSPKYSLVKFGVLSYYIFVEFFILSIACLSASLTKASEKRTFYCAFSVFACFAAIILWPNFSIRGVESIGYSITRIKGDFYGLVVLFLLAPIIYIITLLVSLLKSNDVHTKSTARLILVSFSPMIAAVVIVVILMMLGSKINATIAFSCASILTTLLLVQASSYKDQTFFFTYIPKTKENKRLNAITHAILDPEASLSYSVELFERYKIQEHLLAENGNRRTVAKILQVSPSTLSRKIRKYGLE